jgi:D-alanine-D-alanine ligase
MIIGLTYNLRSEVTPGPDDPIDRYEEFDSDETIDALESALRFHGHTPHRLGWGRPMLARLEGLRQGGVRLDGVFNMAEGIGGRGRESQVPATLEMLGIPFTGSDPLTIGLSLDKGLAKMLARSHGIPTAPFRVAANAEELSSEGLRFPLFVKPAAEGSSMGITSASLCPGDAELRRYASRLLATYGGPVLIEEYLPGSEFTVGIVGNGVAARLIGTMQIVPKNQSGDFIYSLDVKRDYLNQVDYLMPPPVDAALLADVNEVAMSIYRAFGCRDVARIDIRCDRDGRPNFVEFNPLPGINPNYSDLVILARLAGWTYEKLIGAIVDSAIERWSAAS